MVSDITQILVVSKNEVIKCVRGRKFLVSLAVIVLVFLLITAMQFVVGNWDDLNSMGQFMSTYFDTFPTVITLVVALLSSIALVSEFEERTALILFTRPVRRTSVFIGKVLSCTIIEALIILAYYAMATVVALMKVDDLSIDLLASYGLSVLYAFAASGIAFIISAFLKKGSVCTVISILLLVIVFPIASTMVASGDGENWYMIDQAGKTVCTCVPEYVDMYNETLEQFGLVVDSAVSILEGFTDERMIQAVAGLNAFMQSPEFLNLDPGTQMSLGAIAAFMNQATPDSLWGMIMVLKVMATSSLLKPMEDPDLVREAGVMLAWGIVAYLIAWARFIRREF